MRGRITESQARAPRHCTTAAATRASTAARRAQRPFPLGAELWPHAALHFQPM